MNPDHKPNPNPNQPLDTPWLPWHRRILRQRQWLEYWLRDQHHQQWISDFREIGADTIEFRDYVSQRTTRIRSDQPIVYRITEY
jgi:hypothetical protein